MNPTSSEVRTDGKPLNAKKRVPFRENEPGQVLSFVFMLESYIENAENYYAGNNGDYAQIMLEAEFFLEENSAPQT